MGVAVSPSSARGGDEYVSGDAGPSGAEGEHERWSPGLGESLQ